MKLWEILVPTQMAPIDDYKDLSTTRYDLEAKPVRKAHHKQWDAYVENLTGGLTILRSTKGMWRDRSSGQLFTERMIPVRIMCEGSTMDRIAAFTLQHYRQKAVMYYLVSTEAVILHGDKNASTY